MAKSKSTVEVDVKVDDKGNLGQVGNKAKKAGSQFGNLADNARTADRRLKGASAQSANGTKNFSKMAQGVGGLVGIYATLAAQVFAVTAAFQFFQRVGDLRVLQDSQVAYASTTGVAIGNLSRQVRSAADGFLTFEEASKAAAIGIASGLTQDSLIKLGKGAAAVSKVLGRDVADSFDRLVRGVTKAEPELLDELGITLRLEDAKNKFAISLNKTAGELSLLEQKQAVNVEVQRQLEEKFISTTEAIDTQGNAIKKFGVAFNNVFVKFANVISGPVEAAANFFSENITSLIAAIALFSGGIIKTMLPSFDAFTSKAEESASRASAAYDQARQSFKAMQDAQGQQGVRTALSGVDARPGSGIANLQGGKEVTKRQAAALLRYANMEKGVYNELTRYQKTVYKKALKDILGAKETFAERSKRIFFGLGQRINTVTKGIAVQWKRAMASMSAAVTKLGTAVDKAFKIFFAINIGLIAFNAAVKGLEKLGVIDKVPQSLTDLQGEIDENRTALQGLNKEFARLEEVIEKRIAKAGAPTITIFKTIANAVEAASKELQQFTRLQNTVDAVRAMRGGKESTFTADVSIQNELGKLKTGTFTSLRGPSLNIQDSIESAKRLEAIIQGALTKLSLGGQQVFGNLYKTVKITNGGLTKTVRIINEDLVDGFIALGQTVTSFEESFNNSNRTFDRYISNIKTFQTTVSDQINATINEIDAITSKFGDLGQVFFKATASDKEGKDLFSAISKEAEQLRVTLEKRLGFLFLIADMETKIAEEKEDSAVLHNLQMQRATKLVQQRLQAEKQIRDLDDQRRKLTAQIALSQGENIKKDKDKLSILEKQEANLRIQVDLLKEQQEFLFKLGMAAAQAFEDGLSKGLEGLISGEETSFTKVLLNIVDTIKKAMAKRIAESITEQIMSASILQKITGETAEQKMQAAIAAGGLEAAALMEAAMKKGADFFLEKLRNASTVTRNADGTLDTTGVGAKVTQTDLDKLKAQQIARDQMEMQALKKQLETPTGTIDDPIYTISRTIDQAKTDVQKQRRIQEDTTSEDKGTDATISLDDSVSILDTSTIDNTRATDALSSVLRSGITGGSAGVKGAVASTIVSSLLDTFLPVDMAKSGGIMTPRGKVSGYAHGGVARGPMSGYPAILHGREAVVPLPNGKAIPVEMKNGGGTQNNIVVNVSADGRTTTQGGGADMDKMGIAIAKAVQVELQNQKRSGGILNPYGVA